MVNRKGWIRIVEASIAIIIVLSTIVILYSNNSSKISSDLSVEIIPILNQIAEDNELRTKILSYNLSNGEEETSNEIILNDLHSVINSSLNLNKYSYAIRICAPTEICGLKVYPIGGEKAIFVEDRLIGSTLSYYNPKKIKLFVWEK